MSAGRCLGNAPGGYPVPPSLSPSPRFQQNSHRGVRLPPDGSVRHDRVGRGQEGSHQTTRAAGKGEGEKEE